MWKNTFRILIVLLLRKFVHQAKNNLNSDLNGVKENIAVMVESRAAIFKQNFNRDIERMAHSFFAYLFVSLAVACAGLTAILWLVASAWNSPHRDMILATMICLPLVISIGVICYTHYSWKKEPLFNQSFKQIENDWLVFRAGLENAKNNLADSADEPA